MNNKSISKLFMSNTAAYIVILFLISLLPLLTENNLIAAGTGFAVWVAVTIYSFVHEKKREKELFDYVQSLVFRFDETAKESMTGFPMPIAIFQKSGNVIWYNENFRTTFGVKGAFDITLKDIAPDVDANRFFDSGTKAVRVKCGGRIFDVLTTVTSPEDAEAAATFYWIEETKYEKLKQQYEETRPVVCSIIVDNYDEVMQNTPDEAKSVLAGNIEKQIVDLAKDTKGIVKKIEKDRYFFVFESQYLGKFTESKFDILEKIKNINNGNKLPVTVSIGVGIDAPTLGQNELYSRNAMDMALGRGGDQVVIKDAEKFTYFGGGAQEQEKSTRVKTRVMAFAFKQLISQAENVVIMGHKNADLDSFGASVGMLSAIMKMGKPVYAVLNTANRYTAKMLKKVQAKEEFKDCIINGERAKELVFGNTLLIVVDVFRPSITECEELLGKTENIAVIDHHRKSAEFIENVSLAYHETYASSACEMVTELLQYIDDGKSISTVVAEALYAGIELDTKNFTFKTGVRTLEAAAYLRKKGVDSTNLKLLFQNDREVYTLKADIIKNCEIYKNCIAISYTKSSYYDIQSINAAAADDLLGIEGITASFTVCSADGVAYVSARSIGKINVQRITELIGGGGHNVVAGAQLKCGINEAIRLIKRAVDKYMEDVKKDE